MCVVKGPAQGALAKIKKVEKRERSALPSRNEDNAQAESKSTPPPVTLRPLNEETSPLRPLKEDSPPLRGPEEDTSRLSSSSEEAVLDTSLSAESKELASSNAQATSSIVEQDQRVTSTTVVQQARGPRLS